MEFPRDNFSNFKQMQHDYIGYQSLTDVPRAIDIDDDMPDYSVSFLALINRLFILHIVIFFLNRVIIISILTI